MSPARPLRLQGQELLTALSRLQDLSKEEQAIQCGYVKISKSGEDRPCLADFYDAFLQAQNEASDDNRWFIETTCVSYSTKIISSIDELTEGLLVELLAEYRDGPCLSPFCNTGDYDIEDLACDIPEDWTITEEGVILEGCSRLSLAAPSYESDNTIELRVGGGCVKYLNLGGLYPVMIEPRPDDIKSVIHVPIPQVESPFVLFAWNSPKEGVVVDECPVSGFTSSLGKWRSWMAD